MALAYDKRDKTVKKGPLNYDEEREHFMPAPVTEFIASKAKRTNATLSGYIEGASTLDPQRGIEAANRAHQEVDREEDYGAQLSGSVIAKTQLAAKENEMMNIESAIDQTLVDPEMDNEERGLAIQNLLNRREQSSGSIERYAKRLAAYSDNGTPDIMDQTFSDAIQEIKLKQEIGEEYGSVMEEVGKGAEGMGLMFKKSIGMRYLLGEKSTEQESASADLATDFAATMLTPLAYGAHYVNFYEEVFPEEFENLSSSAKAKILGQALPGTTVMGKFEDKISDTSLPPKERMEYARRAFDYFKNASGLMGLDENNASKMMMMGELFNDYLEGNMKDADIDRFLGNVTGLLDLMPFAAAATRGGMAGAKALTAARFASRGRAIERLAEANPDAAASIRGKAVNDEKIAESIGESKEDIILETAFPASDLRTTEFRSSILPHLDILNFNKGHTLYTEAEKNEIASAVTNAISEESLSGASYVPSASFFSNMEDTGFTLSAAYGKTPDRGFDTPEEALSVSKSLFPSFDASDTERVSIVEVAGNALIPVKNIEDHVPSTENPHYLFRVNRRTEFDADIASSFFEMGFPENTARFLGKGTVVARTLRLPTGLMDGPARRIVDDANISQYASIKNQSDLNKAFNDFTKRSIIKPLKNISSRGQEKVFNALGRSAENDGWYSSSQLKSEFGFNDKEVKAYQSIAEVQDFKYVVSNRIAYNKGISRGYQSIDVANEETGDIVTLTGKVFDVKGAKSAAPTKAYDAHTGKVVEGLTSGKLEELYEDGYKLVRSESANTEDVKYSLIKDTEGMATVRPLDPIQLPYIPGYFGRIDDNNFFIQDGDGRVIASARTEPAARRIIEKHGIEDANIRYARELSEKSGKSLDELELEALHNSSVIFGHRGARELIGAEVADPLDSTVRTSNILARMSGASQFTTKWRQSFLNEWGKMLDLPKTNRGDYVWPTKDKLEEKLPNVNDKLKAQIRVAHSYINMVDGLIDTSARKNAAKALVDFAGTVEKMAGARAGKKAADIAKTNPLSFAKSAAFYTLVAPRPARQALLQSMQPLLLMGVDPKYMFSRLPLDHNVITTSLLMDKRKPGSAMANSSRLAKAMGISEPEFKALYKEISESGILQAIDYHAFSVDTVRTVGDKLSGRGSILGSTGNAVKGSFEAVKKMGFDYGEYNNQVASFLVAWRKVKKDNPDMDVTSADFRRKVTSQTARYTLGMTGRGNLPSYSQGILSLPTQFFSIQHKAAMAWWPARAGGDVSFTGPEKLIMATSQLGLFGLEGLGFGAATNKMYDVIEKAGFDPEDEQTRLWVKGGLFDLVLMETLGVKGSESFAPGSSGGYYNLFPVISDFVSTAMRSPEDALASLSMEAFGPAGETYSRAVNLVDTTHKLFKAKGVNLMNPTSVQNFDADDAKLAWIALASMTTAGSDYFAARATQKAGVLFDTKGRPTQEGTEEQARMRSWFGIRPGTEGIMNHLLFDIEPSKKMIGEYTDEDGKKDAKAILETVDKLLAYTGFSTVDPEMSKAEKIHAMNMESVNRLKKIMPFVLSGYDEEAAATVGQEVERLIIERLNRDFSDDDKINSLYEAIGENKFGVKNMESRYNALVDYVNALPDGQEKETWERQLELISPDQYKQEMKERGQREREIYDTEREILQENE